MTSEHSDFKIYTLLLFFRYTSKGTTVYAIVLDWPKNNKLNLGSLDAVASNKIYMLGYPNRLKFTSHGAGVTITFPFLAPNELPSQWAWVLKVL